uniref:Uncharacterized protein n=1 Tax=Aegilops tauschii subsp. strangulata TaxID=200361 RepID=A0A452ZNF9_AEGTS
QLLRSRSLAGSSGGDAEQQPWRLSAPAASLALSPASSTTSPRRRSPTTAAAVTKARESPYLLALAANPTFVSGMVAFAVAQAAKALLTSVVERRWSLRTLCSSGGMPSSHSALCTALTASVALCHGVGDALFPVCLGFSLIVMYDATGVRRHAGMQAEVLNKIVEDLFQGHPISERKLKELLGHTPSQVFAGAFLGILVAWFCCQGCIGAI